MAAGEHFTLMEIEAVPEHIKNIACDIYNSLTEYKAKQGASFPYDSDVRVTMKKCSPKTAINISKKMWLLYIEYKDFIEKEQNIK